MSYPVARILKGDALKIAERYAGHRYPIYVPLETVWMRNRHAKHGEPFSFVRPMFPGYVFFHIAPNINPAGFRLISDPRIRLQLLMVGDKMPVVSEAEMLKVRLLEQSMKDPPAKTVGKKIEPGVDVQVIRGVLAKAYATVLSVRGGRVALIRLKGTQGKELFVNLSDLS